MSGVSELIAEHNPHVMAIEKVFLARNPQAALVLGHARGVAMLAGVNAGLEVHEYSATEIKKSVVGRGRADKAQVQHMMKVLLGLPEVPESDAADALACAYFPYPLCAGLGEDREGSDMIAWMKGILRDKKPPVIVLDIGGVGYQLDAPMPTFYDLPEDW